jgi:hypothetical protein
MFLLDRLLIGAPVAGFKFVLKQIADMAERELAANEEAVRQEIFDLHREYEQGALDEATFVARERRLLARWREARSRRQVPR